jgi:uncharacterized repeat protein (TIGR03803 family)
VGGFGTVYRLTPNAAKTVWTYAVLYTFKGGADGGNPDSEVTFLGADLFGLTPRGGTLTGQCSQDSRGCGTFFRLRSKTPIPWTHAVLYRFKNTNDGMEPGGALALANNIFYGTTRSGGSSNKGTVFKLTANAAKTLWTENLIYQFKSGNDGRAPQGVVFHGADLVGVTETDGTLQGAGTIFSLHPVGTSWTHSQLDRFTGSPDGESPEGRLLVNSSIAYGVTFGGGLDNGTVFELFR